LKADNEEVQRFLNEILKEITFVRQELAKLRERVDAFSPEKRSLVARLLGKK
jgi:hypothetical protein